MKNEMKSKISCHGRYGCRMMMVDVWSEHEHNLKRVGLISLSVAGFHSPSREKSVLILIAT